MTPTPGRNCTCVVPFRRRMPQICSATGAKMVARLGAAPSISSFQARRVPVSLAHVKSLMLKLAACGVPRPSARQRLIVVLPNRPKMWVVSVTPRIGPKGHPLYRRPRSYATLTRCALILKMVDRHGFAPCSPACEAGDILNDRAAHGNVWGISFGYG